ncbi:metal-dependent hydrolase, partial [Candidatus Woesearchaeota archaeon]|nr:metal-dependent hydrolase [Candidatus Woesearchaeota archaeon]
EYVFSHFVFFFWINVFILLGSILPDSDSEDNGSYIFHTRLKFLASLVSWMEYPLMFITKRSRGHRQSLHTIFGILVTSLFVMCLFSLILIWLFPNIMTLLRFFVWSSALFFSQLIHLIFDKVGHPEWKISFF